MLSRTRELSLIARCMAVDDRHAFGELVEAYSDRLRSFLLSLTRGDVALVDDLAQDTFLKAYLSIRSLRAVTQFRIWLFRIAYNEFISHMRRSGKACPLDDSDGADIADEEEEESEISDTTLAEALMSLTDAQRTVVQLFYFEELSIARITSVTGICQNSVKSHLSRARRRLASLLEKYRY